MLKKKLFMAALILSVTILTFSFLVSCASQPVEIQDATEARGVGLLYLVEKYDENVPDKDLEWEDYITTAEELVGSRTKQFISDDWLVTISYPIVLPENTIFNIVILNIEDGWHWEGSVSFDGTVTEIDALKQLTKEGSQDIALEFIKQNPTFVFDGIEETLKFNNDIAISIPFTWTFVFQFDSAHAGYGDRTGRMLAEVISPHEVSIAVEQGEIVYASMDNKWDMLNQKELSDGIDPNSFIIGDEPDISGAITEIDSVSSETVDGKILVELEQPNNTSDKFWVTIEKNTSIYEYDEQDHYIITFNSLQIGQNIEVWFKGAVMESYPAQVSAGQVLLRTRTKMTALEGTRWVLSVLGEEGNLKAILDNSEITVSFNHETGLVQGSSGCNTYGGAYNIQDNTIDIKEIEATEIGCVDPEGIMEQEQEYLRILLNAEEFQIDNDTLTISTGNEFLYFTASTEAPDPVPGIVFEFSCDNFEETNHISLSYSPEIGINDTFSIRLCSNPTTGFRWSEAAAIGGSTVVSQIDHSYSPPEPENEVGAAGIETFTFQGLKAGKTNISMSYDRPWEGGEKGAWTFDITVVIK